MVSWCFTSLTTTLSDCFDCTYFLVLVSFNKWNFIKFTHEVNPVKTFMVCIILSFMASVTIWILWRKQVIMVQFIRLIQKQGYIMLLNTYLVHVHYKRAQLFTVKLVRLGDWLVGQHTSVKYKQMHFGIGSSNNAKNRILPTCKIFHSCFNSTVVNYITVI